MKDAAHSIDIVNMTTLDFNWCSVFCLNVYTYLLLNVGLVSVYVNYYLG